MDKKDSFGFFDLPSDTLREAEKNVGTRPCPDRFVLIRTNELEVF